MLYPRPLDDEFEEKSLPLHIRRHTERNPDCKDDFGITTKVRPLQQLSPVLTLRNACVDLLSRSLVRR